MFEQKIKQTELAEYLGVSKGYMSLVVSGQRTLTDENFSKLINNPFGWDTSILLGVEKENSENQPEDSMAEQPEPDTSLVEYLKRKVAELEGKVEKLTDEKADLLQQNAVLKYENQLLAPQKGRNAEDAESSLSASAAQ